MLSLPEVLACFQLASVVAQPVPMHPAGARVDDDLMRRFGERGGASGGTLTATAQGYHLNPAVTNGLWWRSVWRSLACTACAQ